MWYVFIYILFVVVVVSQDTPKTFISAKCGLLLQLPSSLDTFEMLKRTLNVNCFSYYQVGVNQTILYDVEQKYNNVIASVKAYEESYSTNEHVLYNIKSWLTMDAAEPLTKIQRSLKECNSQLLVNFFGNEDIRLVLPTFIQSLNYMISCFNRIGAESTSERTRLLETYLLKEAAANTSNSNVKSARQTLENVQDDFGKIRSDFESAIDASYTSIKRSI